MAESLFVSKGGKEDKYFELLPQLDALLAGETDLTARLANTAAALNATFDWLWVGFYLVRDDELVLGPFQGPVACFRIKQGRGVCGGAWARNETLLVPDVEAFPGHIACSSLSKSEIVLPVMKDGKVIAVLDIDSDKLGDFDERDKRWLELLLSYDISL